MFSESASKECCKLSSIAAPLFGPHPGSEHSFANQAASPRPLSMEDPSVGMLHGDFFTMDSRDRSVMEDPLLGSPMGNPSQEIQSVPGPPITDALDRYRGYGEFTLVSPLQIHFSIQEARLPVTKSIQNCHSENPAVLQVQQHVCRQTPTVRTRLRLLNGRAYKGDSRDRSIMEDLPLGSSMGNP